ncbi:MAG: hypothetical protein ABI901_13790 [Roseiflexaceae bacterium]
MARARVVHPPGAAILAVFVTPPAGLRFRAGVAVHRLATVATAQREQKRVEVRHPLRPIPRRALNDLHALDQIGRHKQSARID